MRHKEKIKHVRIVKRDIIVYERVKRTRCNQNILIINIFRNFLFKNGLISKSFKLQARGQIRKQTRKKE